MKIKLKKLNKEAKIPMKVDMGAAAFDLYSIEEARIGAGMVSSVATGIALEIPDGYFGLIWPRSGLAFKETIVVVGGCIDASFRGEIKVGLTKSDSTMLSFLAKGSRIAQLLILPVPEVEFEEVAELSKTERGERGFGASDIEKFFND